MFSWKGKSLEEYWDCILNALIQPDDDDKGHRPELIVDYRGDIPLLIHEGKNVEEFSIKDGTISDSISMDNAEFNIVQTNIKRQLEVGETDKQNKIFNTCMELSEETST